MNKELIETYFLKDFQLIIQMLFKHCHLFLLMFQKKVFH